MLLQLAHFNSFPASIQDFQHGQTWLLISTCVLGEWEREGRQAEQEEQDSSVIMGWQEQRENWTGGGGKNVRQDKNASSWLPVVKAPTQMCGRRVLSLFYLPMKNTNS